MNFTKTFEEHKLQLDEMARTSYKSVSEIEMAFGNYWNSITGKVLESVGKDDRKIVGLCCLPPNVLNSIETPGFVERILFWKPLFRLNGERLCQSCHAALSRLNELVSCLEKLKQRHDNPDESEKPMEYEQFVHFVRSLHLVASNLMQLSKTEQIKDILYNLGSALYSYGFEIVPYSESNKRHYQILPNESTDEVIVSSPAIISTDDNKTICEGVVFIPKAQK